MNNRSFDAEFNSVINKKHEWNKKSQFFGNNSITVGDLKNQKKDL